MFNHILFDLDSTIYNYDISNCISYDKLIDELGHEFKINKEQLVKTYKREKKKYQNCCYGTASSHNKYIQIKKVFDTFNLDLTRLDYYYNLYNTTFNSSMELYPYCLDFIKFCKSKDIKLYILTNNLCKIQLDKLQKLQIIDYFDKIYTSEEFGIEKPDIKLIYYIISDIGCHKSEIVKIGDNYKNDIESVNLYDIYAFWFNENKINIKKEYLEFNNYSDLLNLYENYYMQANNFINITNSLGERFDLVQAGGGNTSFKIGKLMFIKSSGCHLSDLEINKNYVGINFQVIKDNISNITSLNKKTRELESKEIVDNNIIFLKNYNPSIETTLHTITKNYTIHIHPIQFNMISALPESNKIIKELFSDNYFILDYFTPGIDVTLNVLPYYSNEDIIFLKNHGLVCTANTIEELNKIIQITINKLESYLKLDFKRYHFVNDLSFVMKSQYNENHISYLSEDSYINTFIDKADNMDNIFKTFVPDKLIYCGVHYVNSNETNLKMKINDYTKKFNEKPKLFLIKLDKYYLYITSNSLRKCQNIESVFKAHLMCFNKNNIILEDTEIDYLNNWEAEKFRKSIK